MFWMYVAFAGSGMRFVPVMAEGVAFRSVGPSSVSVLTDGRVMIGGVEIDFGGSPSCIEAEMPTGETFNYYGKGREIRGLSTYRRVALREVYPGVDVLITPLNRGALEVQFVVKPGGSPSSVRVKVGNGNFELTDSGAVVMAGGREVLRIGGTYAYQGAEEIPIRPVVEEGTLRFRVGRYDPSHTLVIDPVVSTVIGGSSEERITDVAVAPDGNVYVVGYTASSDYPGPRSDFGTPGSYDVFVSRLTSDLSSILSTAVIAGSGSDKGYAITFLPTGEVVVVGSTDNPSDFAPSRTVMGTSGGMDAFVTVLSSDLSSHVGTVLLASPESDMARVVEIAPDGNLLISGVTMGPGGFAPSRTVFGDTAFTDVFVSKVSPDLTTHFATAIVGGTGYDYSYGMAVLPTGNVVVAGWTDYPNNFAPSRVIFGDTGSTDGFITKLSRHLNSHISTAILASTGYDYINAMDTGEGGSLYVAGYTSDISFAGGGTVFGATGMNEAFIAKMDTAISSVLDLIFISSPDYDMIYDIAVVSDRIFVAGATRGSSLFSTSRVVHGTPSDFDAFTLAVDTTLASLTTAVILAASYVDEAYAISPDTPSVVIGGYTYAGADFAGGSDTLGSVVGWNAFVARVSDFTTSVREKVEGPRRYEITDEGILVHLREGAYVGYDAYDATGRLVGRHSAGYLPAGSHLIPLKLRRSEVHLLRLRIGKTVEGVKLLPTFRGRSRP